MNDIPKGDGTSVTTILSCTLGPLLFGTAFIAIDYLPETPVWNAALRVLPAGVLLICLHPALMRGVWVVRSAILGLLNFAGFFAAQALAAHRLPGAIVATIGAAQCLVVPLVLIILGQRLGNRQFVISLVGLLGVALLVLPGDTPLDTVGLPAAAALAVLSGTGMVLTKHWGVPPHTHPITATAWQMLIGGALLIPIAALAEGPPPPLTIGQTAATLWLAVPATAVAFTKFFGGLHRGVSATTASRLMLLVPVVAAILGWVVADNTLSPIQIAGMALVLAAQFTGAVGPNTRRPHRPTPTPRSRLSGPRGLVRPGRPTSAVEHSDPPVNTLVVQHD